VLPPLCCSQPLLDTLTQPLTDLSSVHVVKEAAQVCACGGVAFACQGHTCVYGDLATEELSCFVDIEITATWLHMCRFVLPQGAGAAVNELWRQGQQLRMARDVMEMFKHEVGEPHHTPAGGSC
jgi:hypothetical protein